MFAIREMESEELARFIGETFPSGYVDRFGTNQLEFMHLFIRRDQLEKTKKRLLFIPITTQTVCAQQQLCGKHFTHSVQMLCPMFHIELPKDMVFQNKV